MGPDLFTRPVLWEVGRDGGYVKKGSKDWIVFANIRRLHPGHFLVEFCDDRVSASAIRLNLWDGEGPLTGPVKETFDEAVDLASEAIEFTLSLVWAKDRAEKQVEKNHISKKKVKS
jgi:hypothetical protein